MSRHPPPEVPCRPARPEEIPSGAAGLARLAERHGWAVHVTYARGTRSGRVPRVVDSIAVRLALPERWRAYGVWVDGKYDNGCAWGVTRGPHPLRLKGLKEIIANG